jgi:glutathione synthase/RimK-type ligase-like ATP-grasp enzyme
MHITYALKTARFLFERAQELGLEPVWLTDYGAFSITFDGKNETYFQSTLPFNNVLAGYLTNNKHLTRLKAAEINEKNIPYSFPQAFEELTEFLHEHKIIIGKPTRGSGGENVIKITNENQLASLNWKNMIFERYIEGTEWRVLALDGEVLGIAKKTLSPLPDEPWHKHWEIFSEPPISTEILERATKVLQHLGLRWGAVDFIEDESGVFWLLEANYSPGFVHFHEPDAGKPIDIAGRVWQALYPEKVTL